MEPKNHPIERDNHLLKPPFLGSTLTVYGIIELICDLFIWSVKCSPLRYHNILNGAQFVFFLFPLDMMACLLGWHPFYIC